MLMKEAEFSEVFLKHNLGLYDVRILFGNVGIDKWDRTLNNLETSENILESLNNKYKENPNGYDTLLTENNGALIANITFTDNNMSKYDNIMSYQCGPNPLFKKYFRELYSLISEHFKHYHVFALTEICASEINVLAKNRATHIQEYSFPPSAITHMLCGHEINIIESKKKFGKVKGMFTQIGPTEKSVITTYLDYNDKRSMGNVSDFSGNKLIKDESHMNLLYDCADWSKVSHDVSFKIIDYTYDSGKKFISLEKSTLLGNNFKTETDESCNLTLKRQNSEEIVKNAFDTDINTLGNCYGNAQSMMIYPDINSDGLTHIPLPQVYVVNVHNKFHSRNEMYEFAKRVCSIKYRNVLICGDFNIGTQFKSGDNRILTEEECDNLFTKDGKFVKFDTSTLYMLNKCSRKKHHMRVYHKIADYTIMFDAQVLFNDLFMLPASSHTIVPIILRPLQSVVEKCAQKNRECIDKIIKTREKADVKINENSTNMFMIYELLQYKLKLNADLETLKKLF